MTNEEAWRVVSHPLPPRNYRAARARAVTLRILAVAAVLAVIGGALWGLSPIYEAMK